MVYDIEFAFLLAYIAIGVATTVSVNALATAMIDEDVYGLPDNAPSNEGWQSLLWKCVVVMLSPLALAVCMAIRFVMWVEDKKSGFDASIYSVSHSDFKV
ncbi:MAG: hypothetical protein QNJ46_16130 [Leptolyngbyaceae cyanobacterium MO_188.B28]|nr:hypothetical protein [Leptolyngbyaceae cyanobacterium MO_188.B28]